MNLLKESLIILFICLLSESIHQFMHTSLPGNILGMLILLICLYSKIIKLEMIEKVSSLLLKNLAFFFIPAGVGLISCFPLLKDKWLVILAIIFLSTVVNFLVTGLTIQILQRRNKACKPS